MYKNNKYFKPNNKIYMVIISALVVDLLWHKIFIEAAIMGIVLVILIIYNIKNIKIKKGEWRKFIEDFSSKLDVATKNTLIKFPFPLMLVSKDGNILWYNHSFSLVNGKVDILGVSINELIKEIRVTNIINEKNDIYKHIELRGKYFDIHCNVIDTTDKEEIILLYFYDVTEIHQLKAEMEEKKKA